MARQPLKITVITVTYNAGALVDRTFNSVEEQDYPYVEHLVIDGNSTDDTLEKFHHYMERNSNATVRHELNCLSENDYGIYDAMNKGLALATGRYIVFLNAGDKFHAKDTLSCIARAIQEEQKQPAVVYGDTHIVDSFGNLLHRRRLTPPENLSWKDFNNGMLVCHQSFYARAFVHDKTLYDHWGRMKTRQALAVKNIGNEHIEQALATIDEEEYQQILRKLLLTKTPTIKAATDYERAQKLLRFAAGRGFEADLVFRVMGED